MSGTPVEEGMDIVTSNSRKTAWSGDARPSNCIDSEGWDVLYESALEKSSNLEFTLQEHLEKWLYLYDNLRKSKSDPTPYLLKWCKEAIQTIPTPAKHFDQRDDTSIPWYIYLEKTYGIIDGTKITYDDVLPILKLAEKRFAHSYGRASEYWQIIRELERKYMEKNDVPLNERNNRFLDMYKRQFSNLYVNIINDHNAFRKWIKYENLDNALENEITISFKKAKSVNSDYNKLLNYENIGILISNFKSWVEKMLCAKSPSLITIQIQCEEFIYKEPSYVALYMIYINALTSEPFLSHPGRNEKLGEVIKAALMWGSSNYDDLLPNFMERCMFIASTELEVKKTLELADYLIERNSDSNCPAVWHGSGRAVMVAIRNLIVAGHLSDPKELKKRFLQVTGHIFSRFMLYHLEREVIDAAVYDFITKYVDILKLWLFFEKSWKNLSCERILEKWRGHFVPNRTPHALILYTDFFRLYGSPEAAEDSFKLALDALEDYEFKNYSDRKGYLKLLTNYINLKLANNSTSDNGTITDLYEKLYSCKADFNVAYEETYDVFFSTSKEDQQKAFAYPILPMRFTESDEAINTAGKEEEEKIPGFPVFIRNLAYNANDSDIIEAFKNNGLTIVNVDIKRNNGGKNAGQGVVELQNKEEADKAVKQYKHTGIEILGRKTIVAHLKKKKAVSLPARNTSTALILTDCPRDFIKEINRSLAPYGHIKTVSIMEDHIDHFTAKVEFHMPEDADNAFQQWKEGKIFQNTGVKIRKGFAGGKNRGIPRLAEEFDELQDTDLKPTVSEIGPSVSNSDQKSKTKRTSTLLIPNQVKKAKIHKEVKAETLAPRTHMKRRLVITGNASSTSAVTDKKSDDSSEPAKKISKLELTEENELNAESPSLSTAAPSDDATSNEKVNKAKSLSNDDFRRMINENKPEVEK